MGLKLKSYFFSAAMLIATAAHAEAAAAGSSSGRDDTTYRATEASADPSAEYAAPDRNEASMSQEAQARPSKAADPAGKKGTVGMEAPDYADSGQQAIWGGP